MTAAATHIAVWALGVFTGMTLTIFALAAASTAHRDRQIAPTPANPPGTDAEFRRIVRNNSPRPINDKETNP